MANNRREDKAHDVGDSMPGTVGDSQGTIHDRRGGQSINLEDDAIEPEESNTQSNQQHEKQEKASSDERTESTQHTEAAEDAEEETTRMKYAKRYGDSWPENRKQRFLREHEVSAREMGWKLTE